MSTHECLGSAGGRLVSVSMPQGMTAAACLALAACSASPFDEATLVVAGANVIDVQFERVLEDHMVVVSGDRILGVEETDLGRVPRGTAVVDGEGAFIGPGLWDMHVHALSDPDDAVERVFPLLVANGITGVRDMGAELDALAEVRERLASNDGIVAPRLAAAGPLLDGVRKPWYGELPVILGGPEEVPDELDRLRQGGIDFYKVYDDLTPSTFETIARYANGTGMAFAGHVPHGVPMTDAARLGIRSIEHLGILTAKDCVVDPASWFDRWLSAKFEQGYEAYYALVRDFWGAVDWTACDEVFASLSQNDVFFTPTLVMELNDASRLDTAAVRFMRPESRRWCSSLLSQIGEARAELREGVFGLYLSTLRRMRDAGVAVLAGSDTPNNCISPGFALHWELELLVEAGLTPYEALRSATTEAARALGREAEGGLVAPGYWADLVLFDANPLEDIGNAKSIRGVVTAGRWHDAGALDAMRRQAENAAGSSDESPDLD